MPPANPTAAAIDGYLQAKGSPLTGLGSVFEQAGRTYGVDPKLLVAIAGAETSFGKTGNATAISNPFGWGPHIRFRSFPEAINTVARGIRTGYLDKGLTTIPQIQSRWAPLGAANDPTNLNSNWTRTVSQFYREQGGTTPATTATGPRPPVAPATTGTTPGTTSPAQPPDLATDPLVLALVGRRAAASATNTPSPLTGLPLAAAPSTTSGPDPVAVAALPKIQPLPRIAPELYAAALAPAAPPATPKAATVKLEVDHDDPVAPAAASIVKLAKQYLGTPYKWGGTSPQSGFDCSGFAQWLAAREGIALPRTTYDQVKAGRAVRLDELQPGDLVFFDTSSQAGPDHIGIAIGDGQFIHAPHKGDVVKISSLSSDYYRTRLTAARRIT